MSPEMLKLVLTLTDAVQAHTEARMLKASSKIQTALTLDITKATVTLNTAIEILEARVEREPVEFKLVKLPGEE